MTVFMHALRDLRNNRFFLFVLASVIFFSASLFINFLSFRVPDPDGFYHIRHAWLYRTNGIFDTSFPWTQYSVIKDLGADLWYGFHIFLIPFTFFDDLVFGIKIAAVVIAWLALFLSFLAFYRLRLRFPILWPLLLPALSLYMVSRLSATRPHSLSMGLNILLFSFLVKGGPWPVFFISFVFSFLHLNLFWIPILTLLIISIGRLLNGRSLEINKAVALIVGIIAGGLLKPHPLEALRLNYIQLVDIALVRMENIGLRFGNELYPLVLSQLSSYFLPFLVMMVLLFVWLVYRKNLAKTVLEDKIAMWTLLILTFLFLMLSIFVASRAMEFFMSYFLLFSAFNITFYLSSIRRDLVEARGQPDRRLKIEMMWGGAITLVCIFLVLNNFVRLRGYARDIEMFPGSYRLSGLSRWLELNTKPKEVVFHLNWDTFPELFFWNQHNYYINGMDPIFMYKYNENLYWEHHFLSTGQGAEYTCSFRKCDKTTAIKTYDVIRNHFRISYILIDPFLHPEMFKYLVANPDKFEKVFADGGGLIYKLKSEAQ